MNTVPLPRLHLLTDDHVLARPAFEEQARSMLMAGDGLPPWTLHLRGPRTPASRLYTLAEAWSAAGLAGRLTVNDRVDIAASLDLPGLHLGQRSLRPGDARELVGAECRIGVSVHSREEADAVGVEAADFLMAGHVFSTPSHAVTPNGLRLIVELSARHVPVIGVGGISPARVGVLLRAGAHGVAILRGVWDAPDPAWALTQYLLRLPPKSSDVP